VLVQHFTAITQHLESLTEVCGAHRSMVVHADTVNCFKSRLDKFWSNQELIYNFRAEICGTGSRSEVVY